VIWRSRDLDSSCAVRVEKSHVTATLNGCPTKVRSRDVTQPPGKTSYWPPRKNFLLAKGHVTRLRVRFRVRVRVNCATGGKTSYWLTVM
jgi:hypothetical protein